MRSCLLPWLILPAALLAACGGQGAPNVPAATPSPAIVPTQMLPTTPPTPWPQPTAVTSRPTDVALPEAAVKVMAVLSQQLQVSPDQIKSISIEKVEWPDSCLGVQTPGVACALVVTPGYKIVLEVNGQRYEYHTNASGTAYRLASAPNPTSASRQSPGIRKAESVGNELSR